MADATDRVRRLPRRWNRLNRSTHRWVAVVLAVPILVMVLTGVVLQFKPVSDWVQPPTARGASPGVLSVSFEEILSAARGVPGAGIDSWADVDRVDVRPGRSVAKVRGVSRWEVQVDLSTGEVVQAAYRRSDFIEDLHTGRWGGEWVALGVFLPAGLGLLALWVTGMYLWILPGWARRRSRRLAAELHGESAR